MHDKRLIHLPNQEEMLQRLTAVDDEPTLTTRLYPLFLKHAGQDKYPLGVIMAITFAIDTYSNGYTKDIKRVATMFIPEFIKALVKDAELQVVTLMEYQKMLGRSKEAKPVRTTFDPAKMGSEVTLSSDNLTATIGEVAVKKERAVQVEMEEGEFWEKARELGKGLL